MNLLKKIKSEVSKGKIILEGKLNDIEKKRKKLLTDLNGIDFSISQAVLTEKPLENLIKAIIERCNKLSEICQKHCANNEKSGSDPYLKAISTSAENLIDALNLVQKNNLTPTLIKTIHDNFKDLTKECLKASKASFALSVGAKLDYRPTKNKFKVISNQISQFEKAFGTMIAQVGISIMLDNFNSIIKDNVEEFFTKCNVFKTIIYFPTNTPGKYEQLKIDWNFNRYETTGGKLNYLVASLTSVYNNAMKRKLSTSASKIKELSKKLEVIIKDLPKELTTCSICQEEDLDISSNDATVLPCQHSFHTECIQGWFGQNHTCPICRKTTPKNIVEKILAK